MVCSVLFKFAKFDLNYTVSSVQKPLLCQSHLYQRFHRDPTWQLAARSSLEPRGWRYVCLEGGL